MRLTAHPFRAAFSRIAAAAIGSISPASTWPRRRARLRSRRCRSRPRNRARAARARAPDGRGHSARAPARPARRRPNRAAPRRRASSRASLACQIGVISLARWSSISGTSGGRPGAVSERMKASVAPARIACGAGRRHSSIIASSYHLVQVDADEENPADPAIGAELGEAVGGLIEIGRAGPARRKASATSREADRRAKPAPGANTSPSRNAERGNPESQGRVALPNRSAVERTPINASSSLSWCA